MDRVLEIGGFAAGYCGRLLVQAGHEVVRVEPATPPPGWVSTASSDLFLHAGKRRVQASDPGVLAALASRADVVVAEADSADQLDFLGFDAWSSAVKVAITPFGRTGPGRNWPATPAVLLAMGGYTFLMGDPQRAPLSLPGHYVEYQSGQYACTAASALRLAGESNSVDISMLEVIMSLSQYTTVRWHCSGVIRSRHGNDFWSVSPSNLYACADGWVYLNIVPSFWDPFTAFIDQPELTIDERFATNEQRMQNRQQLHRIVGAFFASRTRHEIQHRAVAFRVPLGVVMSFEEVLADPHLQAREFWQRVSSPGGESVRVPSPGFRIDREPRPAFVLTPVDEGLHG